MKPTTFTLFLAFLCCTLSAFAQNSNNAEGQEIILFGETHYTICAYAPANTLCTDLTYFEEVYQPNGLICGIGLTDKELRKMSKQAETMTPVFTIIDLEGNIIFTSTVEMEPCQSTLMCGLGNSRR